MARANLLDRTRIALQLHDRPALADSAIEQRLADLVGDVTVHVSRWFDLWKYIRWLLPAAAAYCRYCSQCPFLQTQSPLSKVQ